jgi:hypothetical protein
MKVVKGKLKEDLYTIQNNPRVGFVAYDSTNFIECGSVGFKSGNKILHKITNVSDNDDNTTVSVHIYSKPGHIQNKYEE